MLLNITQSSINEIVYAENLADIYDSVILKDGATSSVTIYLTN